MKSKAWILCMCLFSIGLSTSYGQGGILGKIAKKTIDDTVDKTVRGVENKASNEISDYLSRKAVGAFNTRVDDMKYKAYRNKYGDQYTDKQIDSIINSEGGQFDHFMKSMNKAADVPPVYVFDIVHTIETKDFDKEKYKMDFLHSDKDSVIGMRQYENKSDYTLMILDGERNIVVIVNNKDGELNGQAISSDVMDMAATYSRQHNSDMTYEFPELHEIKGKKIAGYNCKGREGEDESEKYKGYFSTEPPINWHRSMGAFLKKFVPNAYNEDYEDLGTIMEYEAKRKEDGKKTTMKTKSLDRKKDVNDMTKVQFEGLNE